ncbi:amiloride-sensitive sodium channel [Culex quinquefasciatus]|uniref:Amiloride-sensitive sodium channel n=1 Tax=Culex quinquefasciatus TaxID=7176 RepID=B0X7T4_CULQU|nr:amiloride-sensitive sodium channel [Culex quinquefasciatus]|eukprot:XP_001865706.1 amiloride-sensitive sodium channel [Culex quinquefasciatus]
MVAAKYSKRLYWLVVGGGLLYMMLSTAQSLVRAFLDNSLSFSIDTAYLHWNTTFPAVSVCQLLNDETMAEMLENNLGPDRPHRLDNVISEIAFYGGTCHSCEDCARGLPPTTTCPANFTALASVYRLGCPALLADCTWLGQSFDCCELFRPLATEFGRCFSVNSLVAGPTTPLMTNRHTGPGSLRFRAREDLQLFLHDPYAVPFAYTDRVLKETVLWGMHKEIIVKVVEMENGASLGEVPIARRNCRFPWEVMDSGTQVYASYSFSSCAVECFMASQVEFCNCSHHLMPKRLNVRSGENICNFDGLTCLTEHSVNISQHRKLCPCLSSCIEPEYSVVFSSESDQEEDDFVTVRMLDLPNSKFLRHVARTELDLFISLGSLVGLFFGASLLSIANVAFLGFHRFRTGAANKARPE